MESVTIDCLRQALAKARGSHGAVLVVGEGVLRTTLPRTVLSIARWPWCIPLVVQGQAPLETVLRWKEAGAREVVEGKDLGRRLLSLVETPFRGEVPLEDWVPGVRGNPSEGARLLLLVPHLQDLTVRAWATEAGRSERAFRNDCRALYVDHPRDILWHYVDASYRAGRKAGRSIEEMAKALAFFDVANLRRAYRRRRLRFPG